jgi:site-specific DNA-methyltransferase (cytosine-N4-specific)
VAKHSSTPEPAKSRVSRQAEYLLHLSIQRAPFFDKAAWQALSPQLGGPNMVYESAEKITDVWCLPTSSGKNGHGAEFPLALAGRCIALTSRTGDLVLDPFVGSGTTAVAAVELGRRCVGYDISKKYIDVAERRVFISARERQLTLEEDAIEAAVRTNAAHVDGRPISTRCVPPVVGRKPVNKRKAAVS